MPAKSIQRVRRVSPDVPSDPKPRSSGRLRKPSAKALGVTEGESLILQRLDELGSGGEDSTPPPDPTDGTYHPRVGRSPGKGKSTSKNRVVPSRSSVAVGTVEVQDIKMESPPPSTPVLRPISDTEDNLPSPSTLFVKKDGIKLSDTGNRQVKLPKADTTAAEGTVVSENYVSRLKATLERVSGSKARVNSKSSSSSDVVPEKLMLEDTVQPVTPARKSGKHKGSAKDDDEVDSHSKGDGVGQKSSVFSGAVSLLDEDEDDVGSEVEDESSSPNVDPLLDEECIHPHLVDLYRSLRWINSLRRSKFIGYTNIEDAFDDFKPVSYGGLVDTLNPRVRSKLVRSVLFMEYKDFKNPSRVPLAAFSRNWECLRLPRHEGVRSAAFVLTGVCMQSYIAQGREVGQSYVKQLHVRPIENDWAVFQANVGTFFNDDKLHAPGRRSTLVFQTKCEGWSPRQFDKESDKLASTPYSSPSKDTKTRAVDVPGPSGDTKESDVALVNILRTGAPPYRLFEEGVPLYDGRTRPGVKGFRFEPADWDTYTELATYPHPEVEANSLVTVVFTLTGFRGTTSNHHTVHFNALFAIVLGKVDG
ncbi:hypothetical protein VNI00_015261 [Paramarasmius palmivorus]|uniref:Uncharacterized protein n=1 Tax=Paramarasmius palmivorus TaxID=297713 RepID=A0AAW0BM55_9AGAR